MHLERCDPESAQPLDEFVHVREGCRARRDKIVVGGVVRKVIAGNFDVRVAGGALCSVIWYTATGSSMGR